MKEIHVKENYKVKPRIILHRCQLHFLLKFNYAFFKQHIRIHQIFYGLTAVDYSCMVSSTKMFPNSF